PPAKSRALAGTHREAPEFRQALVETLGEARVKSGAAVIGEGAHFLWAIESPAPPRLTIDDAARPAMSRIQGTDLWLETGKLATGKNHTFYYLVDGKQVGGSVNLPSYGTDSYEHPGVPQGKLSPMITHLSKIYDGME